MQSNSKSVKEQSVGLSLSDARKLAKYYGNICQKHNRNETDTSPEEKQKDWESLSYCRCIILQKSRKTVS